MYISAWLDIMEADKVDFSQLEISSEMTYDEDPDEIVHFIEIDPCGILCDKNHQYSTVERFARWYYCRGQDKKAGIHSNQMKWRLFTRNKQLALQTAKEHIE